MPPPTCTAFRVLCGIRLAGRDQIRADRPDGARQCRHPTAIAHCDRMRLADHDDWARAHHGIITRDASGLSRSAWYRSLQAGTLIPFHPGVARLPGTADTAEQRIVAGVLALGTPAVASHRSAALLWGIPRPADDPVDVITLDERRDLRLDGVVIHRPRDRLRLAPQRRFGIACTNILRTLLDLGAVDPAAVCDAVGHVLSTRLATLDAIETAIIEHAQCGRSGVVALRDAVDRWSVDSKPADSLLESTMRRLIRRYALPAVEFHPVIEGFEVDFRIIHAPVIIECDGWTFHGLQRSTFERDRRRDAVLTAAGWIVLRFTYRTITTRPSWTAARIREATARWCPTPHPHTTLVPPDGAA